MNQDDPATQPTQTSTMDDNEFLDYAETALLTRNWLVTDPHVDRLLALVRQEKHRRAQRG